jgi:plasmid stabilization system protein ParE
VKYRVTILPLAKRQMLDQALWWSEKRSAEQAFDWLDGFEKALASLAEKPERCVVARESEAFDFRRSRASLRRERQSDPSSNIRGS